MPTIFDDLHFKPQNPLEIWAQQGMPVIPRLGRWIKEFPWGLLESQFDMLHVPGPMTDPPLSITWKVLKKDTQCTPMASTDMSTHAHIHWYTHVHTHIGALNMHKLTQLHTHQISTLNRLLLFYISSQYSNLFYIVYRTLGLTKRPEKTRSKCRLFPQNLHTLL